jgi:hypothetical protein
MARTAARFSAGDLTAPGSMPPDQGLASSSHMSSTSDAAQTWSIGDVYLLTDGTDGRVAVPELRIDFVPDGLVLAKADDETVWSCRWDELGGLTTAEHSVIPDGREGIVMVVAERSGRRHRFVLPSDAPAELEVRLREMATVHGLASDRPGRAASRMVTALVVLATGGTLAVLLLAADHVIHF